MSNDEYYTRYGKFETQYRDGVCAKCGKKRELQAGSDWCDECILDVLLEKLNEKAMGESATVDGAA